MSNVIKCQHGHTRNSNWLTCEYKLDNLIACHSIMLHVIMMRGFLGHLHVALDKMGSN